MILCFKLGLMETCDSHSLDYHIMAHSAPGSGAGKVLIHMYQQAQTIVHDTAETRHFRTARLARGSVGAHDERALGDSKVPPYSVKARFRVGLSVCVGGAGSKARACRLQALAQLRTHST